jgi:hypothetical protein
MAIGFNIQFRVNPTIQSYVIRLTDSSTGFTLSKGNFVINYPDGSIRHYVDFNTPDISASLGYVDVVAPTDTSGNVLTGSYTFSYITLDSSLTQRELVKPITFDWIAPAVTIKNLSDSALPEVKFQDATSYTPSGSFTGVVTSRTFSVAMPSTSAVSGSTPSTSTATLDAVVASNYYEGSYTPSLSTVITYTHTSVSGLTVLLTSVTTKIFAIKKAPTRNELVIRINAFRAIIDGYKELNDTQFEILSEQYDILMALYFHLIERAYSATLDGSQDILNEILSILDPYTTYTYQSGPISAFYIAPLGSGTVTSVGLTTPTGLTTSGSPITSSGTLAIAFTSGYSIPTTVKQSNWDDAYTWVSAFPTQTGNSGKFLTTNGSALSWATNPLGTVTSVGLSAPTGFSVSGTPVTASGTLALAFASGYSLPSDATQATWTAKQNALNGTGFVKATGTTITYDNTTYYPYPTGTTSQYVAGDGTLIAFPTNSQSGTLIRLVRNQTGNTLTKGTVVYINGATGNNPTVTKALATSDSTSAQTFGLCQSDIANNATGYVVIIGDLVGLDTSAYTEGAQLYLSSTLAGTYTTTKQYAPAHLVYIGVVTRSHPNLGQIEVKIQNGYELDEIHDVAAQTPSNNDGLFFETSTSLWKNKSIATILGYTPSNDSLVVHLAGTETITGQKTFRGTTASDSAPLGSELATVTGTGANWTLVGSNLSSGGYAHITGSTTALTTSLAAVIGTYYQITYTISGRTAGSITISYGGININNATASGNTGPLATSTSVLTITPTTDFDGTVVLSVKSIGNSSATTIFTNSSGSTAMEIRANSAVTNTFVGNSAGLKNTTASNNTFLGTSSGSNNTTGANNTFLGSAAGYSNTTGANNISIGLNAGFNNTTGAGNIFLGTNTGLANTSGIWNVAIGGQQAFSSNTSGGQNVAIGFQTLQSLSSGSENTALGNQSGQFISGGSTALTTSNNSIFIGASTKALGNSQTNQIVIGYQTTGLGSNTTVLGNSSTLTTAIYGNLLLGTTTDAGYRLDVNGTTRIQNTLTLSNLTGASDRVLYVTSTGVVTAATIGTGLSFSAGTLSATGTASGSIGGSGTSGYIPKFTGTAAIGNSNIQDSGSLITLGSNTYISSGSLAIGTSTGYSSTGISITNNKILTGNTVAAMIAGYATIASDVTSTAYGVFIGNYMQAAAFTLSNYYYYYAAQQSTGGGSTITNQYGYYVGDLAAGTSNYSFYGNTTAGTNKFNLYMNGTANNYMAGSLGIGITGLTQYSLRVAKNITGNVFSFGINQSGTVQSDVTSAGWGFQNQLYTAAASFTLSNYYHFFAEQQTIGAGSTVNNQYGFFVNSTLTGATGNYGFRGQIPSASNNWNIYMDGTAKNYLSGSLLIGSTTDAGYKLDVTGTTRFQGDTTISSGSLGIGTISSFDGNLKITKDLTGSGGNPNGIYQQSTILSDVTGGVILNRTSVSTQAASFTVANINHYFASQGTIGSGSSVTAQYGFNVSSNLIGATTNIGFVGQIPAGTNNWNLYMNGTANNYLAGSLGIGSTSLSARKLVVAGNITGSTTGIGIRNETTFQSDVTSLGVGYSSFLGTQAASFTLTTLSHYITSQGTIGSGSTVTNQYGFFASSSLTGATNNYGFFGEISSGTNRWNLYMNGTADNFIAGSLGIGSTGLANSGIRNSKNISGSTISFAYYSDAVIQSDVTTRAAHFSTYAQIQNTAFTLASLSHYEALAGISGAATITTQIGFKAHSGLVGATNNIAFSGEIGSSANNWNLYMSGTAKNYISGSLLIGSATDIGEKLQVTGNTRLNGLSIFQGTSASDLAPLGSEIATTGSGTNWTGTSFATGYTHTSGSTANLTDSSVAVIGTTYRVAVTITGRTAGSITISYGGENYVSGQSTTRQWARQAITTAGLVVTPTSDFDGTVVFNINSVGNSSASITFANSSGGVSFEIRNDNNTSNLFIGTNAGRKSVNVLNNNIQNTFIGNFAGQNNSNGRLNTFVGHNAAFSNASGDSLTAIGSSSLYNNTTGFNNTAIGQLSLSQNTIGFYNTAVGVDALNGNTTGNNNVALGTNAGKFISNGSTLNTITNNSIFIGSSAYALADSQTNQIVIGYGTIGLGSNTTVLGNSSTTLTALYGAVITGGTSINASAQLQVDSTTKGVLFPRMTTTQKNAISSPATGLVVFDTTLGKLCVFSTTWQTITSS